MCEVGTCKQSRVISSIIAMYDFVERNGATFGLEGFVLIR